METTPQRELTEYNLHGIVYKKGQLLKVNDIAHDLIHSIKEWRWWNEEFPELGVFMTSTELDFHNLHYCYTPDPNYAQRNKEIENKLVIAARCSKTFSRSIFPLTKIFNEGDQVCFLLGDHLIHEANEAQPPFTIQTDEPVRAEKTIMKSDLDRLPQIIGCYKNLKYGFFSDLEFLKYVN